MADTATSAPGEDEPGRRKHKNQYTTPPLTPEEAAKRVRQIVRRGRRVRQPGVDWAKILTEWVHTDKSEFPTIESFCKVKGFHPQTLQRRGGRQLWYDARNAVHDKAIAKALEKAPDALSVKYEDELNVKSKLVRVVDKFADRLLKDPDKPEHPGETATPEQIRAYEIELDLYRKEMTLVRSEAIKTLAEAVDKLVEVNERIHGNARPGLGGAGTHVNVYPMLVQAVQQRDKQFGVIDEQ